MTADTVRRGGWRALAVLVAIYMSSFIDRTILSTLGEPIRHELGLSDMQLGMLGGLAFAATYSILGVPIARLAERFSRKRIIIISVTFWSAATAACGWASNFIQLLLLRGGVGLGEAGFTAPAHALISDFFPPARRATALAIFSLAIPLGVLFGALVGGMLASTLGWRWAFVAVGVPGFALALIAAFALREPARGEAEPGGAGDEPLPSFIDVARHMLRRPAFLHVMLAGGLVSMTAYANFAFTGIFFIRRFDVPLESAGALFALCIATPQIVGMAAGGYLTDAALRRGEHWLWLMSAISLIAAAPFLIAGYLQSSMMAAAALLLAGNLLAAMHMGPQYSLMHSMLTPRIRATAMALTLLVQSAIGLGFGPLLLGVASDAFASSAFGAGYAETCVAAGAKAPACLSAAAMGVAGALSVMSAVCIWAGIQFILAGRALRAARTHTETGGALQHG